MGKLILGMNVSLDGYVDDLACGLVMGPPSKKHFPCLRDYGLGFCAVLE